MGVEELGSVRLSCCMLKDLSTRPKFADSLNLPFIEYSKLCRDLRLVTPFNGTYLDFTIIGLHSLITAAKPQPGLKSLYPVILGIIRNLAPFAKGLGVTASSNVEYFCISQLALVRRKQSCLVTTNLDYHGIHTKASFQRYIFSYSLLVALGGRANQECNRESQFMVCVG